MMKCIIKENSVDYNTTRIIMALAWPTMLEQLLHTAVQYIDTAMVGALGTKATAAVGSTTTVNWLIGSTISALGVGFLAYISQAIGSGKKDKAKKASGQAVMLVVVVGILFTAITTAFSNKIPGWMQVDKSIQTMASSYFLILYLPMLFRTASTIFGTILRAAGDTKTPMRVGICVNLINIIFNFILIYETRTINIKGFNMTLYGAGFGINGAAIASAIAYTVGGIAITYMLWKHEEISPKNQSFYPNMKVLKPCLKVAFPNMLQRFGTSFGYVVFAGMINSLGESVTAAHTIANTVESAFYIPGYGMQTAAATLAGNAYGANDREKLKKLSHTIVLIEALLMVVSGGLLFVFSGSLMELFSKDTTVISIGAIVLKMVALSEPFYGVSIVLEGMMQGQGKTVKPFVYNILGMWCVRIIGTFLCIHLLGYGLVAAWGCMIGHNLLLFVLFSVEFNRNDRTSSITRTKRKK